MFLPLMKKALMGGMVADAKTYFPCVLCPWGRKYFSWDCNFFARPSGSDENNPGHAYGLVYINIMINGVILIPDGQIIWPGHWFVPNIPCRLILLTIVLFKSLVIAKDIKRKYQAEVLFNKKTLCGGAHCHANYNFMCAGLVFILLYIYKYLPYTDK